MASDLTLYKEHHVQGYSYVDLAAKYDLDVDSIRGRVSRLNLSERMAVMEEVATTTPLENQYLSKQREIIQRANETFNDRQQLLVDVGEGDGDMFKAVFVSDLHIPYTNWKAVELTLAIIADIQPEYVSGFNDLFDFQGYGRWPDTRPPAARLWEDNIDNAIKTAAEYHRAIKRFAPDTLILQVLGNHDKWMYHYLRSMRNGYTEKNVYDFMSAMEEQGVLQFTNAETTAENIVQISPGLKWVHGMSTAVLLNTVGKNTIERLGEHGVYFNSVGGHTHRASEVRHNGVTHWNSGKLCRDDMGYLKHPAKWDNAIVINEFDPHSRDVHGQVVYFEPRGKLLTARYNGVDYAV